MRRDVPIAFVFVLLAVPALAQSPTPSAAPTASPEAAAPAASPSAPPRQEIQPMSEDMRVKAEDIDSVMADARIFFLDVREPKEIEELGSYQGYVNIPLSQLESRLGELPRDRPILTAWNGGGRAARAAALLEKNGFKVTGFCGLKDYKGGKLKPARKDEKK